MRQFVRRKIVSFSRPFQNKMRWALNFDGVGVRGQLANRAINPDGDIDIEFYSPPDLSTRQVIISQQINLLGASEFYIESDTAGRLVMVVGAAGIVLLTTAQGFEAGKKYRVRLIDTALTIWKTAVSNTDTPLRTTSFTRGATREPTATTVIGAANNGSTSSFARYFSGIQRDIKINGTRWPMADYNQAIQLPEPSGLGVELITPTVLENPAAKGTRWTYLGNGRWQYVGDGSFNELQLIAINTQPVAGYVEFEVESISGQMRCFGSNTSIGTLQSNPVFTSVGVFRHYFLDRVSLSNGFRFSRNVIDQPASCIIKNISFKPLGTCNPMTISNATSANWMQVVDDYVRKFRSVLKFDGVGVRGVLANEVALTGDWDISLDVNPLVTGNSCDLLGKELFFKIQILSSGAIQSLIGNGSGWVVTLNSLSLIAFDGIKKNIKTVKTGNAYRLFINGVLQQEIVNSGTVTPAVTHIGVRSTLLSSSYARGIISNVRINGTLWPIADRNQSIQLPEPSGLGEELITPIVLVNPMLKGTQWTYLGDGRWQYIGDGSYNPLRFISSTEQPDAAYLEYEVESITGSITTAFNNPSAVVNTVGKKRYFFTNKGVSEANVFEFKRASNGLVASCIIKNISFKPLGTCNPIALANVTSANWEDLEI